MHCNGKCHLKKQLEKEDKKENSVPTSQKEKCEFQFYASNKCIAFNYTTEKAKHLSYYLFPFSESHLITIFHPPTV